MKDLNFFEPYLEKREIHIQKELIFTLVGLLITVSILSYTVFNQIRIRQISKDIDKLKSIAEDERVIRKVEEIKRREEEIEEYKKFLEKIKLVDDIIEEESFVDAYLLADITLSLPEDVFFTSISINTDNILLVGNSKDQYSIAELGNNLKAIDGFKEVFIENISSQDGHYNFNINISLKDVNIYEHGSDAKQDKDEATSDEN